MNIPYERTRALIETKSFLQELQDPKLTPRVPASVRETSRKLLRHYPSYSDVVVQDDTHNTQRVLLG